MLVIGAPYALKDNTEKAHVVETIPRGRQLHINILHH